LLVAEAEDALEPSMASGAGDDAELLKAMSRLIGAMYTECDRQSIPLEKLRLA
jgi:hypothetical protein